MESLYNFALFSMASVGCVLFATWLIQRRMAWYWKAIVFVIAVVAVGSFYAQMRGGPKTDMRILTELLATGGVMLSLEFAFRHVRGGWGRAALVVPAGLFLFFTWKDSVDRAMGAAASVPTVVTAPASSSTPTSPAPTSTRSVSHDPQCDDPNTIYAQRQILGCPTR